MIQALAQAMAKINTSRGWTRELFNMPSEIALYAFILRSAVRENTTNLSVVSPSKRGLNVVNTSSGLPILFLACITSGGRSSASLNLKTTSLIESELYKAENLYIPFRVFMVACPSFSCWIRLVFFLRTSGYEIYPERYL